MGLDIAQEFVNIHELEFHRKLARIGKRLGLRLQRYEGPD